MKKSLILTAILGCAAGFALRLVQLEKSFDAQGMVAKGDAVTLLLTLVCAAAAVFALIVCLRAPKGSIPAPEKGQKTPFRGVLEVLAGVALLASYLPPSLDGTVKDYVLLALAFAAACSMAVEGMYHLQGHVGNLLCGCILPLYLAVLLVMDYRSWCYNPLVAQYAFRLLVLVFAMVASFDLAAFRVGKGKRRWTAFFVVGTFVLAGPALADGGVRNILHTAALAVYVAAEFWPFLMAKPIPEPKKQKKPEEKTEEAPQESMQEVMEAIIAEITPEEPNETPEEKTASVEDAYEELLYGAFDIEPEETPEAQDSAELSEEHVGEDLPEESTEEIPPEETT